MSRDPFQVKNRTSNDVLNYFTDREEAIFYLDYYIDASTNEPLKVLMFYGVGGIGKTALQMKLIDRLKKNREKIPFVRLNIEEVVSKTGGSREALLRLRTGFEKIKFPHFDLCLAVIAAREGGDPEPLLRINPKLKNIFDFAKNFLPVSGIDKLIEENLIRKYPNIEEKVRCIFKTEDVIRWRTLEGSEIISELINNFAKDLAEGLPKREGKSCHGVLFLDTYESFWFGYEGGIAGQTKDEWVQELMKSCLKVGVLPIICGKDNLRWAEYDEGWKEKIDHKLLGGLSEKDAQLFLSKFNIGPSPDEAEPTLLQKSIIKCCHESIIACHPFYLYLCVGTVLNNHETEGNYPSPDVFSNIPNKKVANELVKLFLKSLGDDKLELWITELSLTPCFNENVALAIDNERNHYNGRTGWKKLLHFSFIESLSNGFYQFHKIMKEVLVDSLIKEDKQALHEWFCDYWNDRKKIELRSYHQWALIEILNYEIVSDKYFYLIIKIYTHGSEDIKKLAITSLNKKKELDIDRAFTIIEEIINKDERSDVTYFAIYNLIDFINYSPEKVLKIFNEVIVNPKNKKYVYAILNRLHDSNYKQDGTISVLRKIISSDSTNINMNHKRIAYNILQEWGSEVPEISEFDPSMFRKMNVKEIFEFIYNYIYSYNKFMYINEHFLHFILCNLYKINPSVSSDIMKKSLTIPALANFEPIAEVLANPEYFNANIINNFLEEKNEFIVRFTGFIALEFNINNEFKGTSVEKHEQTKSISISIIQNLLNDKDKFIKEIAKAAFERTTRVKGNTNPNRINKIRYKIEDKTVNLATNFIDKVNDIIDLKNLKMAQGYVKADFELTAQHQALFFWLLYNSTLPDSDPKDTSGLLYTIKRNGIIEKQIVQFAYQKVKNDPCGALGILEKFGLKSDDFMKRLGAIVGIDMIGRKCPQKALEILDSALPLLERELKFIYIMSGSTGLLRNYRNEPEGTIKEKSRDILEKLRQEEDSELSALADMVLNGIQFNVNY